MNATLNVVTKIIAFADAVINSNPRLRNVDWQRDLSGIAVADPKSEGHRILAGSSKLIFDGTRATTLDGTTAFSVSLLPVDGASRYRFTWTGGTNPTLRTGRSLTPTGISFTLTANANATLSVVTGSAVFGSVVAGDFVFIPHTTTGDSANVFSVVNAGYWQVLAVTSTTNITLIRLAGESFEGVTETVTPVSNSQFVAFSAAGVQVGDSVDITAGFSSSTQKTFIVASVTDSFFEVVSSAPLPNETGILPTAAGMIFYTDTKTFLYIEASQDICVRVNGDNGNSQRVGPVDASDPSKPGIYMRHGPTWSLTIVNRSSLPVDITVIHAGEQV
jgi:hypothetical protein